MICTVYFLVIASVAHLISAPRHDLLPLTGIHTTTAAPFLRYGKYCGILYSGCPGEQPCDALDACCMHHDNCVQAKKDYLSTSCNEALLECLARLREGTSTFDGNKCMIDEVIDVISVVIEAAVVAGRVLHKP